MNLTHFQPQLDDHIADLLSEANPAECLLEPLNKSNWYKDFQYKDIVLHHDSAEMTIEGWLDAVELITGSNTAFNLALIEQIADTIERQWEIRMQEVMEDMKFEHEMEIERMAVA